MQQAFLIIISAFAMFYAFWTKQLKIALGILILTLAALLQIPNLVSGFWVDVLMASSIILFAIGLFVIVYKKKEIKEDPDQTDIKENE